MSLFNALFSSLTYFGFSFLLFTFLFDWFLCACVVAYKVIGSHVMMWAFWLSFELKLKWKKCKVMSILKHFNQKLKTLKIRWAITRISTPTCMWVPSEGLILCDRKLYACHIVLPFSVCNSALLLLLLRFIAGLNIMSQWHPQSLPRNHMTSHSMNIQCEV